MQLKNKSINFTFYLVRPSDRENLDFRRIRRVEHRSIMFVLRTPNVLSRFAAQAAKRINDWAVNSFKVSNVHPTDSLIKE